MNDWVDFVVILSLMSWDEKSFIEKLESNHDFPGEYIFKFIVKPVYQKEVESLIDKAEIQLKASSGNKYISITMKAKMENSGEVIKVYKSAKNIEGIITL